jgi:FkbM family methyltransferase
MNTAVLEDGTTVHCLVKTEALVLDHHVQGYLEHGVDIGDGDVVFDIGANIGLFGVRAVQRHPGVRVFAFEPVPDIFEVLHKNSQSFGGGRLVPLPFGASDAAATIQIQYYPNSPALSTGHPEFWDERPGMLAEAVRGNTKNAPDSLWYARFVPGFMSSFIARRLRKKARAVDCELRTLSSVIDEHQLERVDVIKIDCEGAELAALRGIEARHWPLVGKVVAEVHDVDGRLDTVRTLLMENGLTDVFTEKEKGFEQTPLVNIYAKRPVS